MCSEPFTEPAYVVDGAIKYPGMRRGTPARLLICHACHALGFNAETGYPRPDRRMRDRIWWNEVAGRGEEMPPTPCVACGRMVIRNADPLLKRVTCSAACSTSLTRIRNGNKGSGEPCEVCGTAITTGRADSRTCSPACRQKAYRRRQAKQGAPTVEARPYLDSRGRRMPQRSQRKALESGMAALDGLCEALAGIGRVEDSIAPSDAARWRDELDAAARIVKTLHGKLRARSGVEDVPLVAPAARHVAKRKNLTSGTATLSGLCAELAGVKELADDITPELAAQWQHQVAGALAGIRSLGRVLEQHPHA
jgi:hypothetical protein